jgi:hypothetical protein
MESEETKGTISMTTVMVHLEAEEDSKIDCVTQGSSDDSWPVIHVGKVSLFLSDKQIIALIAALQGYIERSLRQ